MKKHLIALAVTASFAASAVAQQVSIDGQLDQSLSSNSNVGTTAAGTGSTTSVTSSILYTNFLRFQGSEDLGGGLRASFVISTNLGAISNDGPGAAGANFSFGDRGAQLTLSGGFGAISIGKADTSDANIVDSGPTNLTNMGRTNTNARPSNRVLYTTPSMQGLTANVAYSPNAENGGPESTTAVLKNDGKYQSYGIAYAQGPLSARVYRAKIDNSDGAGGKAAATSWEDTGFAIAYTFGFGTVSLRHLATENANKAAENATTALDVAIPLGSGLTGRIGYMSDSIKRTANSDSSRTVLILENALSKRTMVYGAVGMADNDAAATRTSGFNGTPGAGRSQTGYGVGIRHVF